MPGRDLRGEVRVDVSFESAQPARVTADALIVPVGSGDDAPAWSPLAKELDAALSGELSSLAADARFSGKTATTLVVPTLGKIPSRRVILVGMGSAESLGDAAITRMAGAAIRAARDAGARRIIFALPDVGSAIDRLTALEAAAVGAAIALYRFD